MYYDRVYKVQGYVLFDNVKPEQKKIILKKMEATPLKRLDWPGATLIETAKDYATNRGYGESLKFDGTPFVMERDLLMILVAEHLRRTASPLCQLNPDPVLFRAIDRNIKSSADYARVFDDFLGVCTDESLCFSLSTQTATQGLWGFGSITGKLDLKRIAQNVATVGNGSEFTFDLKEESLPEVLAHLIG